MVDVVTKCIGSVGARTSTESRSGSRGFEITTQDRNNDVEEESSRHGSRSHRVHGSVSKMRARVHHPPRFFERVGRVLQNRPREFEGGNAQARGEDEEGSGRDIEEV